MKMQWNHKSDLKDICIFLVKHFKTILHVHVLCFVNYTNCTFIFDWCNCRLRRQNMILEFQVAGFKSFLTK